MSDTLGNKRPIPHSGVVGSCKTESLPYQSPVVRRDSHNYCTLTYTESVKPAATTEMKENFVDQKPCNQRRWRLPAKVAVVVLLIFILIAVLVITSVILSRLESVNPEGDNAHTDGGGNLTNL